MIARALLLAALAAAVLVSGCDSGTRPAASTATPPTTRGTAPPTSASTTSASTTSAPTASAAPAPTEARSSSSPAVADAVVTPEGMWWGVDSTRPIDSSALRNVHDWYRGARPQLWGRYIDGDYAVDRAELERARAAGVFVYLIVTDRNCSGCSGGDVCGNDVTAAQARADADAALADARRLRLPAGAVLFKDIEEVGGCAQGTTGAYLRAWYRRVVAEHFRVGFYGNVHRQTFAFPRAYCAAIAMDDQFRRDVVLDMNEDEPLIGAPRGSTGPHDAPPFRPRSPACAARDATVIWQYGESLVTDNWTDIDQARPGIRGLLDPQGGVTD